MENKKHKLKIGTILRVLSIVSILFATNFWIDTAKNFKKDRIHFLQRNYRLLTGAIVISAIMANWGFRGGKTLDEWILKAWHACFDNTEIGNFFKKYAKKLGDIDWVYILGYIGMVITGDVLKRIYKQEGLLRFGSRILPAFTRTLVLQTLLTVLLGGARPEHNVSSRWQLRKLRGRPWYTVSGHAFHGAFPFLVASQYTANPLLQSLGYVTSILAGLSRLQTDSHYPSQIFLGWELAYMGVRDIREKMKIAPSNQMVCKP